MGLKVLIRVDRVAAILAGCDCYGELIADIDPAELNLDERQALAQAPEHHGMTDLTAPFPPPGNYPAPPETATPDVHAWLRWRIKCANLYERACKAQLAKWDQEAETYIAYWSQQPLERFITKDWPAIYYTAALPNHHGDGPPLPESDAMAARARIETALADKLNDAHALADKRNRAAERHKLQRETDRTAAQIRRAEQLAAWVNEYMDDNARARFKLNLLPEDEILDAIRAAAYRSLDEFPRYRKIRFNDVDHSERCSGSQSLDCDTDDAKHLTAAQFELYRQIETKAPPGAKLKALVHSCACESCNAGLIRRSVQVVIPVGELLFSREYALDGNTAAIDFDTDGDHN
ncbi:hypothetical protein [Thiospirillum jenense]|uniref:Uncharacterized protein n=1 Tax=Thiospirillum jenense TaxID=1653858 RepID=A0A839HAC2_9GAMM|nr:hypothetical protein [Thiospirillum jenense]MBB1125654.1 hypothetical protein [Thiospirillum jenense]